MRELSAIVGEEYVLTSLVDLSVYETDGETLDTAIPDIVVLPASTEEVRRVVLAANRHGVPFTPRGAGTGLSGGSTTVMGGISLVLTRLTKVLSIDADNFVAHVEVGVPNLSVSRAAAKHNLYFAPDPSSQVASTIGGNIAENAGGAHTLKYGLTTNNTLGVKVVLPDGTITTFGGAARDSFGIDLLGLFLGSEGTLGIATEAYLRLIPRAQSVETMLAFFPSVETGGQAVSDIVAAGVIPAAMEMLDQLTVGCVEEALHMGLNTDAGALLIVELDGPLAGIKVQREQVEECLRNNNCISTSWAANEKERAKIWKARKTSFGALGRLAPNGYVLDGVIPRSKLREAIERIGQTSVKYNMPIANVYHAGDGNLHPCLLYNKNIEDDVRRVLQAAAEILEMCVELGGTLSGEHGIGIEKLSEMTVAFDEITLESMNWVREAFNPNELCNPGKLIPSPKTCGESGGRALLRHTLSSAC